MYAKLLVNAGRASRQCMQSLRKRCKIRYFLIIGLRKLSISLGKLRKMQTCLSIGFRKPKISHRKLCKMCVFLNIGSGNQTSALGNYVKCVFFQASALGN